MNRPVLTNPNYVPDQEYAKQRKIRMQDAIEDYLQDETISSRGIYEEMLSCIDDVNSDRADELRSLMYGYLQMKQSIPSRY